MRYGLYAVGHKGRLVLERLTRMPSFVVTYRDGKYDDEHEEIERLCRSFNISCFDRDDDFSEKVDLRFYVGWQRLIRKDLDEAVVLHDSYLPQMKGFAPTPTALMLGLDLGATAFRPVMEEVDTGPVYTSRRISIGHPMRLSMANQLVAERYVEMIEEILEEMPELKVLPRDCETFSIWRDSEDMEIDWTTSAEEIQRKVYALSYPLTGATTKYLGETIVIDDVRIEKEMNFVERHPGKIWSIASNEPKVVCGDGMLSITKAYGQSGDVNFKRLRARLGR